MDGAPVSFSCQKGVGTFLNGMRDGNCMDDSCIYQAGGFLHDPDAGILSFPQCGYKRGQKAGQGGT